MPFIRGMLRSSRTSRRSRGRARAQHLERLEAVGGDVTAGWRCGSCSNARLHVHHVDLVVFDEQDVQSLFGHAASRARLPPQEPERRALARRGLDPGAAALRLDDLLDERETDAGALDLVARLERLEDAPDPVVELGRDAGAVVADRELVERTVAPRSRCRSSVRRGSRA